MPANTCTQRVRSLTHSLRSKSMLKLFMRRLTRQSCGTELRVQAGNAFDFKPARPTLPRFFKTRKRPEVTMLSEQEITEALKAVKYPGYSRDIVSFGLVKHVAAKEG